MKIQLESVQEWLNNDLIFWGRLDFKNESENLINVPFTNPLTTSEVNFTLILMGTIFLPSFALVFTSLVRKRNSLSRKLKIILKIGHHVSHRSYQFIHSPYWRKGDFFLFRTSLKKFVKLVPFFVASHTLPAELENKL